MAIFMRRREFVAALVGAAAAWPLAVRAQQSRKSPTIGFLGAAMLSTWSDWVSALVQRLRELGWSRRSVRMSKPNGIQFAAPKISIAELGMMQTSNSSWLTLSRDGISVA
jgi:hypothetical protein